MWIKQWIKHTKQHIYAIGWVAGKNKLLLVQEVSLNIPIYFPFPSKTTEVKIKEQNGINAPKTKRMEMGSQKSKIFQYITYRENTYREA